VLNQIRAPAVYRTRPFLTAMIDFNSFFIGFVACMVFDALFSVINFIVERALYYRNLRKNKVN
jgi:hypothetical protein